MPRLRPLSKDEAPAEARAILEKAAGRSGVVSAAAGIQAYCPPILEASRALGRAPALSGTVSEQLRSLVQLRAAQMVRCPF